jgi:hypothetical protein
MAQLKLSRAELARLLDSSSDEINRVKECFYDACRAAIRDFHWAAPGPGLTPRQLAGYAGRVQAAALLALAGDVLAVSGASRETLLELAKQFVHYGNLALAARVEQQRRGRGR